MLAYQSRTRTRIDDGSQYGWIGSYPAVTRVNADGSHSVRLLEHYVERVSHIGLSVTPDGAASLTHRRFGPDGSFDHGWMSRLHGSTWLHAHLGTLAHPYELVPAVPGRAHTVTRVSGTDLRLVRVS